MGFGASIIRELEDEMEMLEITDSNVADYWKQSYRTENTNEEIEEVGTAHSVTKKAKAWRKKRRCECNNDYPEFNDSIMSAHFNRDY